MKIFVTLLFVLSLSSATVVFCQPTNLRGPAGEIMATFKGQDANRSFASWMSNNIVYPQACYEKGIKGSVFVRFILEPDSTLTNIKITQSVHPLLDSAVVQLVRNSPKEWTPRYDSLGIPLRLIMYVPVIFDLHKDHKSDLRKYKRSIRNLIN